MASRAVLNNGSAASTLLTEAENRRTDVFVVLAGYADKMQVLLDADPGLRRRFPTFLNLPNYTASELAKMASIAAIERFDIKLVDGCEKKLCKYIRKSTNDMKRYNASLPIILVERAITNMAVRVQKSLGNIEEERKTKVELKLKYELENNVSLVSFEIPRIEISFNENLDKNFVKDISSKLYEWTNQRWIISFSKLQGDMPITKKKIFKRNKILEEAKDSKIYKKFLESFSDADLLSKINIDKEND